MSPDGTFTLAELAALADVPVRTIRYYISQGLLPAPGREGPGTRYDESVLARLRLIRRARDRHLPLAAIRAELASLTDEEALAIAETPAPEPAGDALEYVRSLLSADAGGGARPDAGPDAGPSRGRSLLRRAASEPDDLHRWLPATQRPAPDTSPSAPPAPSAWAPSAATPPGARPTTPERSQWERIVLEPDVELHVRRPLTRTQNKRVERLLAFARQLIEGDPS